MFHGTAQQVFPRDSVNDSLIAVPMYILIQILIMFDRQILEPNLAIQYDPSKIADIY